MSTTFSVAVRLRGDHELESLICVLKSIASASDNAGNHLNSGGGYGDDRFPGERPDVACLIVQKNADDSGDLVDCAESDRDLVREELAAHPLVEAFYVGPLRGVYDEDDTAEITAALVAQSGGS